MTWITRLECLLIGGLAVTGCLVVQRTPPLRVDLQQAATDLNLRLELTAVRGVSVWGEIIVADGIDAEGLGDTSRVVAFLVRTESAREDVDFWRQVVARVVPSGTAIRVIGYCDSDACVADLRQSQPLQDVPVIAYGEAVASQVVFNADRKNNYVVIGDDPGRAGERAAWRGPQVSPLTVAEDLKK